MSFNMIGSFWAQPHAHIINAPLRTHMQSGYFKFFFPNETWMNLVYIFCGQEYFQINFVLKTDWNLDNRFLKCTVYLSVWYMLSALVKRSWTSQQQCRTVKCIITVILYSTRTKSFTEEGKKPHHGVYYDILTWNI